MVAEIDLGNDSSVFIGRGIGADQILPDRHGRDAVAVFTQPPVSRLARGLARAWRGAGLTAEVRVLPDGEDAKDLTVVEAAYRWLADNGLTRDGTVVGVGGGSVTDVAGFIAATYLRGVEVVHVPTTLLGAVDAAIGGKTGVNLSGKNLVGAFHHPTRVAVDVDILDRLPDRLLRAGLAEALKSGLVGDPTLFGLLEDVGARADLVEVVTRAVTVKARIVTADPKEAAGRAVLNYGHTIGHAVEVAAGLAHGDAVAIGMVAAGRVSAVTTGFCDEDRQRSAIERLGLPVMAPETSREAVLGLMTRDKKRDRTSLRMVMLMSIGLPVVAHVDSATVEAGLEAIGL